MVEELIGNFNFEIQSDDLPIIEPDNEGNEQMDQEINDEIDVSEILNPNRHKGKGDACLDQENLTIELNI
ncbi:hypothetical protein RCL_jg12162.t1 [Rhizophagus clarus]|uniref:Uncharacterized protein n=1 Tax=Rhizophagus clarus TaxID=94130 RepID=A0A8H3L1Q8_9GLOM|nr:hypothetical protein RCL_jg12162.t1 [Rhizophagus clarus]